QEARARALQPLLRERVEAALLAAGWEQRWKVPHGVDHWLYVGPTNTTAAEPAASDQENQVEPETEAPDIILAGAGAEVPGDGQVEELEIDQADQPEPRLSHVVYVIGSEEAKGRGQQPAYSREVFTREVTFTCVVCKQTVTQQRYPGNPPLYCSDACKGERQRERTRERVAKHRKEKKKVIGNNPSQENVAR
ncbi:MAG TPA: hypothetical protein VF458_16715, partial [Ktedonobacteraceae bacterium]